MPDSTEPPVRSAAMAPEARRAFFAELLSPAPTAPIRQPDDPADIGFDLVEAWRRGDARVEADAKALWARLGILPQGESEDERARQLICAAYRGDQLVGLSSAAIAEMPMLRGRFAIYRTLVAPEARRGFASRIMSSFSRRIVERWSLAHPGEKVLGLAAVIQTQDLALASPVWPASGLTLAGYTPDGRQVRVAWFTHTRIG